MADTPLKRILVEEGRRQTWLAARARLRQDELSRIVNGHRQCDRDTQERIAAALGRPVDEVFDAVQCARRAAA